MCKTVALYQPVIFEFLQVVSLLYNQPDFIHIKFDLMKKFMFIYTLSVAGCCSSVLHGMSGCGLLVLLLHAVDIEIMLIAIKLSLSE